MQKKLSSNEVEFNRSQKLANLRSDSGSELVKLSELVSCAPVYGGVPPCKPPMNLNSNVNKAVKALETQS